jgi:hypothetical protein
MLFFNITRILLWTIAVIVGAAAVPSLDQPAVADQSAVTIAPQQPPNADSRQLPMSAAELENAVQDFADRIALNLRLQRLEQQIQTLLNTAPTTVPQQPPIADAPQDFADRMALDQRLQRLEQQIQSLSNMQIQILSNARERAGQTRTETSPKSSEKPKQTTTNYRHRHRHEIDGTALAGKTVDANPAARGGITTASGCPASVPCAERGTAPFTAPTATREPEYDEAGAQIK